MNHLTRAAFVCVALFLGAVMAAAGAQIAVTTTGDNFNTATLRAAMSVAHAGDTIVFQIPTSDPGYNGATSTYTIMLDDELLISKDLTIDASGSKIVVSRNTAAGTPKFHVFHITAGVVAFTNLTITNGFASTLDSNGGGIYNEGKLTVRNCTIFGNAASQSSSGAGIYTAAGSTLAVLNSTVHGNTAPSGDCAGVCTSQTSVTQITNSTITGNTLPNGGNAAGIIARGTVRIRNSIVAGNLTGNGVGGQTPFDVEGEFESGGFNFIGASDASTGFSAALHDQTGASASPIDPKLGALQDNGGFTPTRLALAGSPVLDQGNSDGTATDQRGFARVIDQLNVGNAGDGSDIGAVEKGIAQMGPTFTVTTTAERNNASCLTDDCSLIEALNAANLFTDANVINFAPAVKGVIGTAILTPSGLAVTNPVSIDGPGARLLTVTGRTVARVFRVASANVKISGLSIVNGKVLDDHGGAITNSGGLTLADCRVFNSVAGNATGTGGGIYNASGASLTLLRCTLDGNSAGLVGGAVHNFGTMAVTNCTLSGDTAVQGGGIYSEFNNNASKVSLLNCTITRCTATDTSTATGNGGGGLYLVGNSGQYDIGNSIVAGNTSTSNPDLRGNFTSDGHNFVGNAGFASGFVDGVKGDQIGTPAAPKDPQFVGTAPANNGGPTDTFALQNTSTAINAGDDALAPPADQRGYTRSGVSDIGSFEVDGLPPSQLLNLSSRKQVGTGDNVLIGGFIVVGNAPKKVIVRGIGPSLPLNGALADPVLEIHQGDTRLALNNDWKDTQEAEIAATGIQPQDDRESAIVTDLAANPASAGGASYTATLSGNGGGTGIGLLDIYDLAVAADSQLANISVRGFVGSGDDLLIGGFIPGPSDRSSIQVLVRALGPSLSSAGVGDALQNPILELYDGNGTLVQANDDWKESQQAQISATGIPPSDDRESALIATVSPTGGYTAVVRGAGGTTGTALVELYNLK